jgi:hypothetical protein
MQVFHRVATLWRNLFDKQHVDQDLDDELRSYQDMLADENARSGMNLPDARRKAAVETGGIEQIKEQVREVRMGFSIDTLSRDVRFAMRMLFKQPTFSLTVVSLRDTMPRRRPPSECRWRLTIPRRWRFMPIFAA